MNESVRDYSIKKLRGKKIQVKPYELGRNGKRKSQMIFPETLDKIIDPSSEDSAIRRKELIHDFIAALMPRLNKREKEIFEFYFLNGNTQQEISTFLFISQPYVHKTIRIIEKKILTLAKTFEF